jgi:hypothetical protein
MLREIGVVGAGVPSVLLYFLAAIPLFLVIDRLASPPGRPSQPRPPVPDRGGQARI